jgi:hypothetical protein
MIPSNVGSVPAELPQKEQKEDGIADRGPQSPMSQQHADDAHGHEMHPQKLVQLVGCHDPSAVKREGADRLH